jgi:molybdopterin molybdotransferase
MPEFFNVLPPDEAVALMRRHIAPIAESETIPVPSALGRVLAGSVTAVHALPQFRRSTMDGYAVRAKDTFGASESLPAFLQVIGEVPMGQAADVVLGVGQTAVVHTGGMIPETADAVVQIEHTQAISAAALDAFPYEIELFKAVALGQNVLQIGEDVAEGAQILAAGHRLRPQDLGGLLALGITAVAVVRQPRVAILATGDEVVAPHVAVQPGQIRDINSYTVAGLVQQAGGIPVLGGIIPDQFPLLQEAAQNYLAAADMLVMSAGSSVSVRDMTVQVIETLGQPGVLLHGVATRPGKPTIVGVAAGKPVLGLPGNPVSAMVQFGMFGGPALDALQGRTAVARQGLVWAKLAHNIASESGREDYIPARLEDGVDGLTAVPVFGKSNLIYTLVNADGLIKIPLNKGGVLAGEWVEVRLF